MNYYDYISRGYEELHKEEQLRKIIIIKKHFTVDKKDKLLDVGCGTGLTTVVWDCKRYGIDPSKKLLDRAREKDMAVYKQAYAENIPFKDNFFDAVVSITAIQNFKDIRKGLNEIKRVGKDKFVLSFLKNSVKKKEIISCIKKLFDVKKVIEEEKDLIFII